MIIGKSKVASETRDYAVKAKIEHELLNATYV
jgi:hypothetical protein